jgi:hypothetical protein
MVERNRDGSQARQRKDPPIFGPLAGRRGAFWLKVGPMGLCWVREDVPRPRISADQGDFGESRIADGLLTNSESRRQTGHLGVRLPGRHR